MTDARIATPAFTLRPLVPADAEAAAALIRDTFASIAPALLPPPSTMRETTATVAAQIEAGGGAMAEASGIPVGVRMVPAGLGYRETHLHAHEGFAQPTWVEMEKSIS